MGPVIMDTGDHKTSHGATLDLKIDVGSHSGVEATEDVSTIYASLLVNIL